MEALTESTGTERQLRLARAGFRHSEALRHEKLGVQGEGWLALRAGRQPGARTSPGLAGRAQAADMGQLMVDENVGCWLANRRTC